MWILNIIYLVIITVCGIRFLLSDGGIINSPFNKEEKLCLDGPEMFWCLTFSTGLLAFSANFGIDLMAIRLGILELLCLIGLNLVKNRPVISFPIKIYIVYLLWITIGCIYTDYPIYGLRVLLKYLYPFLLCLFASAAVSQIEVWVKSAKLARLVAVLSLLLMVFPFLGKIFPGMFWYGTARAINYISIMMFSLAMAFFTNDRKKNYFYALLFILPCFIWVFRTSIMGSLVALMAFFLIKYHVKALPIICGILILGVVAVFTIPSLKEKMFFTEAQDEVSIEQFQEGNVTMEQVNTNARSAMWETLERRLYQDDKAWGSGTGSTQHLMYTHSDWFGGLRVPHSDFVQLKCDNGFIGLVLYCSVAVFLFLHCFKIYWSTKDPELRLPAIVAGASMAGVFVTLYSDNVVNYSMATLSMPFGFYGMLLGIKRRKDQEALIEQATDCDIPQRE